MKVKITPEMRRRAKEIAEAHRVYLTDNSFNKGRSLVHGEMGEIIFETRYKKAERVNDFNYDFVYEGKRIEIKSSKVQTTPKGKYEISVPAYNMQETDYYVFTAILWDCTDAWIHGFISKEDFNKKAVFVKKGSRTEAGFVSKVDCYRLPINQLQKMSHFHKTVKSS